MYQGLTCNQMQNLHHTINPVFELLLTDDPYRIQKVGNQVLALAFGENVHHLVLQQENTSFTFFAVCLFFFKCKVKNEN